MAQTPPDIVSSMQSHLCVARRWNSFTPSLPGSTSVGGGYFVYHRGVGIAVDPGFNFLDNLQSCGYALDDIDAIVMTHNHIDHTASFEAILMLIHRLNRTRKERGSTGDDHKVTVAFNPGCRAKFRDYLEMIDHNEPKVLASVVEFERSPAGRWAPVPLGNKVILQPLATYHRELDGECANGVGLVIQLLEDDGSRVSVGMTSDTAFYDISDEESAKPENVISANKSLLNDCAVVVGHLGTVRMEEILTMAEVSEQRLAVFHSRLQKMADELLSDPRASARAQADLVRAGFPVRSLSSIADDLTSVLKEPPNRRWLYKNHLGVYGIYQLFAAMCESKNFEIGVISEFGEEVGSYRHRLARVLNDVLSPSLKRRRILTGDIGLRVFLSAKPVQCAAKGCTSRTRCQIECASCHRLFCARCVNESCIKHKGKSIIHFCSNEGCAKEEYAPPMSRVPRVIPAGFGSSTGS